MIIHVKIFGVGSSSDKALYKALTQAAEELEITLDIEQVSDINVILEEGVSAIPALSVEGHLLINGFVPSIAELKQLLRA